MSLKNFAKVKIERTDYSTWKLYDLDGLEIFPYSDWCISTNDKYSYTTRDKYTQVVAKFLDYLVEANIFGKVVTKLELKKSIENYKSLLQYGSNVNDPRLKEISLSLDIRKLSSASWSNNIAAINSFLRYVFEKEEDEREYLSLKNDIHLSAEFNQVLPELETIKTLNNLQKNAIKQKSFLANLCRKVGEIKIKSGISSKITTNINIDFKRLDFPAIEIPKLLLNTSSYRDRAIYSLLAGTGIRSSEALSLRWDMIDIPNQQIFIKNPKDEEYFNEDIKFKGRNTSLTFFIPELRHIFFNSLYHYQLKESLNSTNHNFVFEFLTGNNKGEPYYSVSRQGFIKEFKKTALRANIIPPLFNSKNSWTPHSLRHFYGVYMLNYIPLKDKNGFSIEEVQIMMGHKSILITKQYARHDLEHIKEQLLYAEMGMSGNLNKIDFTKLVNNKYLEISTGSLK